MTFEELKRLNEMSNGDIREIEKKILQDLYDNQPGLQKIEEEHLATTEQSDEVK
jgi:hypothetical protein